MRWEKVRAKTRSGEDTVETLKKSPGRKGGTLGPGRRWGHTCNTVKNGRFLYVFGGYGKDNCQTNDVHVFDPSKQLWIKPMLKGNPPTPRDSHSCTRVGSSLYIFGGTDGQNPLSDLVVLDTVTNSWMHPQVCGARPEAREGHSATLVGNRLFIFGGCGKIEDAEEVYFNDLHILDTTTMTWTKAQTSGTPPSPRDSHTCSSWNNKIIVVGGEDSSDSYLSDVHILDADTLTWEQLITTGQQLTPRAGHCAVALGKHLFVFGGFTDARNLFDDLHILNLETRVWTKATVTGDIPSSRFSVAGDCLDYRRGILVFIGGCNEALEALDDLYYLFTDLITDKEPEEPKPEKLSLRKELKRKRQEHFIPCNYEREIHNYEGIHMPVFPQPSFPQSVYSPQALGTSVERYASMGPDKLSMYEFMPAEEKIFEAKITDVFHYGYTIESNIDGKQLRGLLFSYKPGFAHAVNAYLTRRSMASEINAGRLGEVQKPKLKIARPSKQYAKQVDNQPNQIAVAHQPTRLFSDSQVLPRNEVGTSTGHKHDTQSMPSCSVAVNFHSKSDVGYGCENASGKMKESPAILTSKQARPSYSQMPPMPMLMPIQGTCSGQISSLVDSQEQASPSQITHSVVSWPTEMCDGQISPVMPIHEQTCSHQLSSTIVTMKEGVSCIPMSSGSVQEGTCANQTSDEPMLTKNSSQKGGSPINIDSEATQNPERRFDNEVPRGVSTCQFDAKKLENQGTVFSSERHTGMTQYDSQVIQRLRTCETDMRAVLQIPRDQGTASMPDDPLHAEQGPEMV